MERRDEKKVKSGSAYDPLFPKAMLTTITKKEGATVADTIRFIPQVVQDTLFHTEKIARVLKRKTVYETCQAIWQFVYDHIAYKKDEDGKEQIRSPARAWHDRGNIQGVDCDCYTVFISSILSNLKIKHVLRITKYRDPITLRKSENFQHIYPIVPLENGSYITIDCVVHNFDYEEPYTEKKDTKMDLEYLNGVNDSTANKNIDAVELIGIYDDREAMAELGRLFKKKANSEPKTGGFKQVFKKGAIKEAYKKGGLKEVAKVGLHVTNRLNPATALLRNGILLAMKANMFKIAQRLRYAYLSNEEASKRGVDMSKFDRLKKVKEKIENIFYGAGGIPENFKKAVLTGRGNRDHQVSGLGYIADDMSGLNKYSSTEELLGKDIYQSEELQLLNGLGEPYSAAASITAATTVLTAIAGLLKGIGSIFPKKDKAAQDFEEGGAEITAADATAAVVAAEGGDMIDMESAASSSSESSSSSGDDGSKKPAMLMKTKSSEESGGSSESASYDSGSSEKSSGANEGEPEGFWDKNKKWIKPVGIGLGTLGLLYAGYKVVSANKKEAPKPKPALSGIPKSKKKQKKKGGKKATVKSQKKKAVALL